MLFSRVTLFPLCGQQSDAVQSGDALASANMCLPEDVIVIAEHSGLRRQAGSGLSS